MGEYQSSCLNLELRVNLLLGCPKEREEEQRLRQQLYSLVRLYKSIYTDRPQGSKAFSPVDFFTFSRQKSALGFRKNPIETGHKTMTALELYGPSTREFEFDRMSKTSGTASGVLSSMEPSNNENNKRLMFRQNSKAESSSASVSSRSLQRQSSAETSDTVIIEEKRRKPHGDGYTVHRYLRGRLLGKGGFAKVYLCTALDTSKTYAVKIVPKANLVKTRARQKVSIALSFHIDKVGDCFLHLESFSNDPQLQAEIKIHRTLKHEHVCEYKHFFEDRTNCYILLELCHNQSLNEMIKRRKRLTEPEAAYFMHQLCLAVKYMHDKNVIHRDLKLGNLFLDRDLMIKVGDLGLATTVEDKEEKRKTICGTPNYIAPEVIQGDKATRGHSFEVDIWSMGVILFTVLVGKPPYEAKDVKATYQRILANEYSFPPDLDLSADVVHLITSMLQTKPSDRLSLEQIMSHPFLLKNQPSSLPSSCLHSSPEWRILESGELVSEEELISRDNQRKQLGPKPLSRQPFAKRNANVDSTSRSSPSEKKGKAVPSADFNRIIKTALSISSSKSKPTGSSTAFKIYDETKKSVHPDEVDRLTERTAALSVASLRSGKSKASSPSSVSQSDDYYSIQRMIDQLDTVLTITSEKAGTYRMQTPRPVAMSHGPKKWVSRYVDYTSKYGLGFLFNDSSSGVFFNDSTKASLEAEGEHFSYIERKRITDSRGTRIELFVEDHKLDDYPESLKKKVTLMKHFRNYLIEQKAKSEEDDFDNPYKYPSHEVVYVAKWLRTKHAILFRLSNSTVQIIFHDQTEVLLTSDLRFVTYVNKNRMRNTYALSDEIVGSFPELEKRLRYTKDIISQLLAGTRR